MLKLPPDGSCQAGLADNRGGDCDPAAIGGADTFGVAPPARLRPGYVFKAGISADPRHQSRLARREGRLRAAAGHRCRCTGETIPLG